MKKLSQLNETHWGGMVRRSSGDIVREEDEGKRITYDGRTYIIPDFYEKADEYNNSFQNFEEWEFFTFNYPTNGKVVKDITFGYNVWDLSNKTQHNDVFVLQTFLDFPPTDMSKYINTTKSLLDKDIEDVIKSQIKKCFDENHMSDIARYNIVDYWPSEWNINRNVFVVTVWSDNISNAIDDPDEFDGKDGDVIFIAYPTIEGWYREFEDTIINAFENKGWVLSKTWEEKPLDETPAYTDTLCFCKVK